MKIDIKTVPGLEPTKLASQPALKRKGRGEVINLLINLGKPFKNQTNAARKPFKNQTNAARKPFKNQTNAKKRMARKSNQPFAN